jgi:hypothetical protein
VATLGELIGGVAAVSIAFGPETSGTLAESAREWLVTDGVGGYAMTQSPACAALPRPPGRP